MAYLGLSTVKVAAQPFGCLVLLDEGLYRLERGLERDEFILHLVLKRLKVLFLFTGIYPMPIQAYILRLLHLQIPSPLTCDSRAPAQTCKSLSNI